MDRFEKEFNRVWATLDRVSELSDKNRIELDDLLQSIKETRKEVGGLGKSYGMHAEAYFTSSLKKSKQLGGTTYDIVYDDLKGSKTMPNGEVLNGQYDVVMANGDSVAIIEIKSKVQQNDVKDLVDRKVEDFRKLFNHYASFDIYLGVAGFAYDKDAEQEAINSGVGILKISGENLEIQDAHLRVY